MSLVGFRAQNHGVRVAIAVSFTSHTARVTIDASSGTSLTTDQARALAARLRDAADQADQVAEAA